MALDEHEFDRTYDKIKVLGQGNYGTTWLIRDRAGSGSLWAGKFMARGPAINVDVEREVLNHRQLAHPFIIKFKKVMLTPTHLVVIMEYASGGELFAYVQQSGRLTEDASRFFFQQLITAVEYCHNSGVYHRDLKLENALIDISSGTIPYLKLCDFGFSKHAVQDSSLKSAKGTIEYLAPEVVLCSYSNKYEGRPSDTWACGVMLFLMLVGGYPFEDTAGQPQTAVRKIVSGDYTVPSDVPLSDSCLDLIRRIFTVQALQRITIAEIKQHPWFVRRMPKAMMPDELESYIAEATHSMQPEAEVRAVLAAASRGGAE